MRVNIYKGTNEIGGSCIALKTKHTTILLDYGTPLKEDSQEVVIRGKIDAIVISHPHQDHFGEIVKIDKRTPIYCGALSLELMNATKIFTGHRVLENNFMLFEAWKSFHIGDFKITPYLVDHSATDAYAFLIEAEGYRILYSGDFRANGRKSKLFDRMLEDKNLQDIDMLLMEGTMLHRSNDAFPYEQDVEVQIYKTIQKYSQMAFVIGSSQNIDRMVSIYRACRKAHKILVVDIYTAWILESMRLVSSHVPNIAWDGVKVMTRFGGYYYQKLQENRSYFHEFTSKVFKHIVEIDEIASNPQNYVLKISPWHIERVLNRTGVDGATIIYSQWKGYLEEKFSDAKTAELYNHLKHQYHWVYAHTSGHADLSTLQKFATQLKPKKVVPIHTANKEAFKAYFDNVVLLEDGECFDLNDAILS